MLSMREVDESGFGKKVRDWNKTQLLRQWRERWADHVNERLAALDIDARIDHRSFEDQRIGLEPQHKIGPAGARRLDRGEDAERAEDHRRIARETATGLSLARRSRSTRSRTAKRHLPIATLRHSSIATATARSSSTGR
jgi:ATP-dependent exoDNAse (exonuclease V) alpha subunit